MAKRRTKEQISSDKIIKANLNILGEQIYNEARKDTRVLTGSLKKSINFAVKPDTRLTFYQNEYGKYVTPKSSGSDNKTNKTDALLLTIKELVPKTVEVIKKELAESVLYSVKNKRAYKK